MSKEPTPEQHLALREFAKNNGPHWRSKLKSHWYKGKEVSGLLQQVRNELGPQWLTTFKFPDEPKGLVENISWTTSDGEIWNLYHEAKEHQAKIDLTEELKTKFAEDEINRGVYICGPLVLIAEYFLKHYTLKRKE